MSISLGEYQEVFLEEAEEQIENLNNNLLALEENHEDTEYINEIFRVAHSLKSSAAFVGLNQLRDLAHQMENLLQQVRDGQRSITDEIIEVLFRCFDVIRAVVDLVSKGQDPNIDMTYILDEITKVAELKRSGSKMSTQVKRLAKPEISGASPKNDKDSKSIFTEVEKRIIVEGLRDNLKCFDVKIHFEEDTPALFARIMLVFQQLENMGELVKTIPDKEKLNEGYSRGRARVIILTDEGEQSVYNTADVDQVEKIEIKSIRLRSGMNQEASGAGQGVREASPVNKKTDVSVAGTSKIASTQTVSKSMDELTKSISQTVKVPVKKLDDLLNNVAELVIANSGFTKIYDEIRNAYGNTNLSSEFKNRIEQMSRIAKDLQGGIMNTRMIPIGTVFKRFNRLVRDLSREYNKDINLILKGEETELDKKVIDSLGEPLLHLIRNSVDHGIEKTEERKALGKDPKATIMLNAYQGGNRIIVEIIDDGKGLNREKIFQTALDKGLVNANQLESMPEDDLYQLIFLPGFSTAEKITDISGRGVGMNVVKEVVSMMSGNVNVETEAGIGTKFTLTFPLTTAIISAIMVRAGEELYAIPLSDVIETIKVGEEEISTIENHEVIYLREDVLSLIRLNRMVQADRSKEIVNTKKLPVVVVGFSNRKVGLVVTKLEGKQEIVIKSLEQNFKTVEGLSGASILGDGSIALILDVQSMINLAISHRVQLEEERYRQNLSVEESARGELSAEEYFREFGRDKKSKDDEDEEPEKTPDAEIGEEAQTGAATYFETEKPEPGKAEPDFSTKKDEKPIPGFDDFTASETQDQKKMDEEAIEKSLREKIDQIQKEARDNILKAAHESGEETNLLDPKEIEAIISESLDNKIGQIQSEARENILKAAHESDVEGNLLSLDEINELVAENTKERIQKIKSDAKASIMEAAKKANANKNLVKTEHLEEIKSVSSDEILEQAGLTNEDMGLLLELSNKGVNNAAKSLSGIVNKKVEMAIPEIKVLKFDQIKSEDNLFNEPTVSFILRMMGDIGGHILLSLAEEDAKRLVDILYGMEIGKTMDLHEDALSALKEITNIIGSSLINVIGEVTKLNVVPSVPKIIKDFFAASAEGMIIGHGGENNFALIMDTEFYISEVSLMGNLYMIPKKKSIMRILEKLRGD